MSAIQNPVTTEQAHITTGAVTSKDGTTIGYRQIGQGPGLVLLHGAMSSGQNHLQLAGGLAGGYTVYVVDRRGRGLSGSYGEAYSIQKEVEDLEALLAETGAGYVLGVSSGALILLQAALSLPAIRKAAIFEPPLIVNGSVKTDWLARYDREIAQGKIVSALLTGMLGAQMGPPVFHFMPRWLLELLAKPMIEGEEKKARPGEVTMKMLAPTLRYDGQLVVEMAERLESFKAIQTEALLLGGSKSPAYLKLALDALEKTLPHARRIEFDGMGHAGTWNASIGGQPQRVAEALRQFFV